MNGKGIKRLEVEKDGQLMRSKWTKTSSVKDRYGNSILASHGDSKQLTEGLPIYISDPVEGWDRAVVVNVEGNKVKVETLTGQILQVDHKDILPRSTERDLEGVTNLTEVIHINEATVLDCLHQRFLADKFYTCAGNTIVAVNPCKNVEYYYSLEIINKYHTRNMGLSPHIFQLASQAYCDLVRGRGKVDQSLIVSGESGAGKTVSAKHLLRYLTIISSADQNFGHSSSIAGSVVEKRVLESNPILEAFGNAATSRNENSSRFGKFTQLQFDRSGHIQGGIIKTYLLEKTRVIHPGQSNFHIFYQLSCLRNHSNIPSWLDEMKLEVIKANSVCLTPNTDQTNDSRGHETPQTTSIIGTVTSMEDIGIPTTDQIATFKVLLAILHLSHIKFKVTRDREKSQFDKSEDSLWSMSEACRLLGVSDLTLEHVLLNRRIVSGSKARRSVFIKSVGEAEARSRRDCLAMLIYTRLFDWLVSFINKQIKSEKFDQIFNLLDIYGFESLGENSLEQLCINYANERLQQHYVTGCLRDMQTEYEAECIAWINIGYHDNRPCVEALHAPSSVFGVLNEEVCLNRVSEDKDLSDRLVESDSSKVLICQNMGFLFSHFTVKHYAGPVTYTVEGMVDKNRDAIPPELVELLMESESNFISGLLNDDDISLTKQSATPVKTMKKKTVLTKFKSSLDKLMASISESDVHYIRCVKPNAKNFPNTFDRSFVLQQLQACGTLETVEICRNGYPARMKFSEFEDRYKMLIELKEDNLTSEMTSFVRKVETHITELYKIRYGELQSSVDRQIKVSHPPAIILANVFNQDSLKSMVCQFGLNKLFLLQAQLETLEQCRESCIATAATFLQSAWRAKCQRCKFRTMKNAAIRIQQQWRTLCQHQLFLAIRHAVLIIQAQWRMHNLRKQFIAMKCSAVIIQTNWRAYHHHQHLCALRCATIVLQKHWRGLCARKLVNSMKIQRKKASQNNHSVLTAQSKKSTKKDIFYSSDKKALNPTDSKHRFDLKARLAQNLDDDSDNESCYSDDSGVMVKGISLTNQEESWKGTAETGEIESYVMAGTRSMRVGDGVLTCRRLTKICSKDRKGGRQIINRICESVEPGFRFHIRPNRVIPFADVVHISDLPLGLLDALTWEKRESAYRWTHEMTDTLIGIQGWTYRSPYTTWTESCRLPDK